MARTDTLGHFLTDVADAIREKKGTSETIQASEFDTEIENLPSGGSQPKTIDELNTAISAAISTYNNYINQIPSTYNAHTNDAMTLYTPNENFKNYVIRHRNSTYQILWFPNYVYLRNYDSYSYGTTLRFTTFSAMVCDYLSLMPENGNYKLNNTQYKQMADYQNRCSTSTNITYASISSELRQAYTSTTYSTLEECINALQDSSTTYSSAGLSPEWGCSSFSNCFTNMVLLNNISGSPNNKDEFLYPTRLSSNETIITPE